MLFGLTALILPLTLRMHLKRCIQCLHMHLGLSGEDKANEVAHFAEIHETKEPLGQQLVGLHGVHGIAPSACFRTFLELLSHKQLT